MAVCWIFNVITLILEVKFVTFLNRWRGVLENWRMESPRESSKSSTGTQYVRLHFQGGLNLSEGRGNSQKTLRGHVKSYIFTWAAGLEFLQNRRNFNCLVGCFRRVFSIRQKYMMTPLNTFFVFLTIEFFSL